MPESVLAHYRDGQQRFRFNVDGGEVEVFRGWTCAVTGDRLPDTPDTVNARQDELDAFLGELLAEHETRTASNESDETPVSRVLDVTDRPPQQRPRTAQTARSALTRNAPEPRRR